MNKFKKLFISCYLVSLHYIIFNCTKIYYLHMMHTELFLSVAVIIFVFDSVSSNISVIALASVT